MLPVPVPGPDHRQPDRLPVSAVLKWIPIDMRFHLVFDLQAENDPGPSHTVFLHFISLGVLAFRGLQHFLGSSHGVRNYQNFEPLGYFYGTN